MRDAYNKVLDEKCRIIVIEDRLLMDSMQTYEEKFMQMIFNDISEVLGWFLVMPIGRNEEKHTFIVLAEWIVTILITRSVT